MRINLCVSGFGNVGRHFVQLINERFAAILKQHQMDIRITAVVGSGGGLFCSDGLPLAKVASLSTGSRGLQGLDEFWSAERHGIAGIVESKADVLLEATPTDIWTGEPGLSHIKAAIANGMHVVSFTKGPLVKAFGEITALARTKCVKLKYSGATAGALPTIDVGSTCFAGDDIQLFEGVLNGTTNYISTRMFQDSLTYTSALAEAMEKRIAEPNPRLDVEGWDTASKTIIIANTVMGTEITIDQVEIRGIQDITLQDMKAAQVQNNVIKLVGQAERTIDGIKVSVAPKSLPQGHLLASVSGTNKGIRFVSPSMGEIAVLGGGSDPRATAAAALKDVINIYS